MRKFKLIFIFVVVFVSFHFLNNYLQSGSSAKHFKDSIEFKNQATLIMRQDRDSFLLDPQTLENYVEAIDKSLRAAYKVDISALNEQFDGLGGHYRDEFIRGLKLTLEGFEAADTGKSNEGQLLLDDFAFWYSKNFR